MNQAELTRWIAEQYGAQAEHPWAKFPCYAVFRHRSNGKWFALVMDIPKGKLGLSGDGRIEVLNVKFDPLLIGSLREERGIYPAYHMSKSSWITIALEEIGTDERVKWLLDRSHGLTGPKRKRPSG